MTTPIVSDRRVFLSQPGYGHVTAGASRGFWRATRLPESHVIWRYREGSLLAANFNGLWADALNLVHGGRRIDYFAMIHADIEPEDWWLDTLVDELEARDLDVLGVAVPIKDMRGVTSLALERPDGDPWRIRCRLTMTELQRLPETFTSADVGHKLLLNTGLWVCRFDESWACQVEFTINDRIVFDTYSKQYLAQCEPEDWNFSRRCHALGLRLGATRKIRLTHRGDLQFSNQATWGEPFDSGWTTRSVVPDDLADAGWRFPADVPGWLTEEEGRALAGLAKGKRVLEVGSYMGRSTICMAQVAEHVVSVDPHDGRGTAEPRETFSPLRSNLKRYGVDGRTLAFVGCTGGPLTRDTLERHHPYDLAFIDGAHDRTSVEADIRHVLPLLDPESGILAFHDYRSPIDPDVTAAVDALVSRGGELVSVSGTVAVVRPPAEELSPIGAA